jgi:hypothetical protein
MNRPLGEMCKDIHFKKIIMPHTDDSLGNCSYLDTCRHMDYCKYIHYKIDEQDEKEKLGADRLNLQQQEIKPKQWINCDLRDFDFTVLGECNVIMLDPPWDIHMSVACSQPAALRHAQGQRDEKHARRPAPEGRPHLSVGHRPRDGAGP